MALVGYASSGDDTDEEVAATAADAAPTPAILRRPTSVPPPPDGASPAAPAATTLLLYDVPLGPERPSDEPPAALDDAAERALLRELTLPRVANLSMPATPPASPPRETTQRFVQLLALKRRGVHFNQQLARSVAAAKPGVMDALVGFVGLGGVMEQYVSALPPELWDPAGLPSWAFREPLRVAQDRVRKLRDATRTEIEFVPASTSGHAAG